MNKQVSPSLKKVSIITVCINILQEGRKDYFEQMFETVQKQTYSNIEHIIVDGASTDGSIEYIQNMIHATQTSTQSSTKHKDFIFSSEPDTGIYSAMNKGIQLATGEYIIFMNTDDYYVTNEAIALLVNALEKKNADFACGNVVLIDNAGIVNHIIYPNIDSFPFSMPLCHNTLLCKTELFTKYGNFNQHYTICADYDFVIRILIHGAKGVTYTQIPLIAFRETGASSLNIERSLEDKKDILNILYQNYTHFTNKDITQLLHHERSFSLFRKIFSIKNTALKQTLLRGFIKKYVRDFLRLRFIISPLEKYFKKKKVRK